MPVQQDDLMEGVEVRDTGKGRFQVEIRTAGARLIADEPVSAGGLETRDRFAREIVLEGDLTSEQRHRLLEIAERCPVHQTLDRGADVVTVLAETPLISRLDPVPVEHAKDMAEACRD